MTTAILDRPWLRWTLRIATVALLLYLGLTVRQLRDQRQEARNVAGSTVYAIMSGVASSVDVAERQLRGGRGTAAVAYLRESRDRLRIMIMAAGTYYALSPEGSVVIDGTLQNYSSELNRLIEALSLDPDVRGPDVLPQITALRMDLQRWEATFTQDLLADGSRDQLRAAVQVFCQELHVPKVMDLTCQAAQPPR